MSRSSSLVLVLAAVGALLSGCADYLNHYDTVSLTAGDAPRQNILLHTKDPFNPASFDTSIDTDGVRAADAVKKYRDSQKPGAAPQPNITLNIGTPAAN